MLLSLMRKHAKSWLIKFLIGIIAVVFVFYFGYSFTADQALKIAYVNGELISGPEYQKAYQDLLMATRTRYKDVWNENMIKMFGLRKRALEALINQRLMTQAAKRLGLDVTENECQKAIMSYPPFQINGQFDMRRYKSVLNSNRMKPDDFETSMTQQLLDRKLKQLLFAFLDVTDQEVLEYYTFQNEKINLGFVQFKPETFEKSIHFDQTALEKYFKGHREKYRVPEKIQVDYVEIAPDDFKGGVDITEKEIKSFYEFYNDAFKESKKVRARHILFRLGEKTSENDEKGVKDRAKEILEKARHGEDFAALAKQYSEGPSRSGGGDLGYFEAGKMEGPFEEVAFKLKKGEISDLVRTRFGYHIIKVEDIKEPRTKPLEEVRDEIVVALSKNITTELAHEKGLSIVDQMPYDIELQVYGKEQGFETKRSGYFSQYEPVTGINESEKLTKALFALGKNESSELVELGGSFYIFQVAERKETYLPDFNEVEDRVKENYTAYLASKRASDAAANLLKELKEGKSWDQLVKEGHVKPEETGFFSRQEPPPKIGHAGDLSEVAFGLSANRRYPDKVFENERGAFVIRWNERRGINEKKFTEEKRVYLLSLTETKHKRVFENWLQNLRKNAEIEIVTPVTGS